VARQVPVTERVTVGFDVQGRTDVAGEMSGGIESRLPSALTRRAAQLDAFQQELAIGVDDPGRTSPTDKSGIASGAVYEDRVFEDGTRQRTHYSDGHEIGMQIWRSDGSYYEKWGQLGADDVFSWSADATGAVMERRLMPDGTTFEERHDDGTVTYWFPGGTDEVHELKPDGDVEIVEPDGTRTVMHPDGSKTEYRSTGQVVFTPAPQQGTGGGEGEGESATSGQSTGTGRTGEQGDQAGSSGSSSGGDTDDADAGDADAGDADAGDADAGDADADEHEASSPIDETPPEVAALLAAGRAYGFHPGAARAHGSTGTGGDVDPADPAFDNGLDLGGPLVDVKRTLLVGPADPEIVGGTGRGTIPDSIQPGSGVIDPSDDAAAGPGAMGPEDDPFGGMQPGLEPEAPDAADDGGVAGFQLLDDAVQLTRRLGLRPTADPVAGIGLADLDDLDG
jgi:hypothetical protein